jgi:crotonobetainyl-CoA:carnitine CoA-transferase CaiB-like acyl-CoA transferase
LDRWLDSLNKTQFYDKARTDCAGPLDGVRVVEVTTTWAGPMAGCMLADFGADVIRIEHPDGDVSRRVPPFYPGTDTSILYCTVNRNKRCAVLDLHEHGAQEALRRVIRSADIFIENFRPGVLAGWGLGYHQLIDEKADLIYVSISGFGQFGPLHELVGYDPLVQMMSGWASLNGSPEDREQRARLDVGRSAGRRATVSHRRASVADQRATRR